MSAPPAPPGPVDPAAPPAALIEASGLRKVPAPRGAGAQPVTTGRQAGISVL